jgi:hypothetical protein
MKGFTALLAAAVFSITLTAAAVADGGAGAKKGSGKFTANGIWIPDRAEDMPGLKMGPFVRLKNGGILTVDDGSSYISCDEAMTWTEYPVFAEPDRYQISSIRALVCTRSGTVVLAFINVKEIANWNWKPDISDSPGAVAPTYAVRSTDGGKNWRDLQKLHDDWTGDIRDMIETRDGNVVFSSMMMRHNPGRHTVLTYCSKDQGETWLRSNVIDLGGIGHHGGITEGTLEQLKDGRLWMLARTNWSRFWEAYSEDDGISWRTIKPSNIEASSAPGLLKRLASGRLVLVWNRLYPEGKNEFPLKGGDNQWSEVPVSNHRLELSIMFSDDDGKSWSRPVVIARGKDWYSYPYVFEAEPGRLWITTAQGGLRIKLNEKDFIKLD